MANKNEGRALYRLNDNPMERAYHDAWKRINEYGNVLSYLLGDGSAAGDPSDRDRLVAATVIQWLGSPVGQSFVEGVRTDPNINTHETV